MLYCNTKVATVVRVRRPDSYRAFLDEVAPVISRNQLRTLSAASLGFLSRGASQAVNLIVSVVASRFILPAQYGIFAIAIAIAIFLHTMTYSGVYDQIIREQDEDLDTDTGFWLLVAYSSVGTLAFMALAPVLAGFFQTPELESVLLAMLAVQPLAAISAWTQAQMLREGKTKRYYGVTCLSYAVTLVATLAALIVFRDLRAMIAFRWVSVCATALFSWIALPRLPALRFDRRGARRMLAESWGLYGSRALNFVYAYGADFLLAALLSPAAAGLYRFAARIGNGIADIINQPMRTFAWVTLSAHHRKGLALEATVHRFLAMQTSFLAIAMGFIAGILPLAVKTLLPTSWGGVVPVFYGVALARVFAVVDAMLDPVLGVTANAASLFRFRSVASAFLLAVSAAGALLGPAEVAWSQALAGSATALAGVLVLARALRVKARSYLGATLMPVALGAGVSIATALVANAPLGTWNEPLVRFALAVTGGGVIAGIAVLTAWQLRLITLSLLRG